MTHAETVALFEDLVRRDDKYIRLPAAALAIAKVAYPSLSLQKHLELLDEMGRPDILLTGGGIISSDDMRALERLGVGRLFGPGTPTLDLVAYIREWAATRPERISP